jgi:hypothetical protein
MSTSYESAFAAARAQDLTQPVSVESALPEKKVGVSKQWEAHEKWNQCDEVYGLGRIDCAQKNHQPNSDQQCHQTAQLEILAAALYAISLLLAQQRQAVFSRHFRDLLHRLVPVIGPLAKRMILRR